MLLSCGYRGDSVLVISYAIELFGRIVAYRAPYFEYLWKDKSVKMLSIYSVCRAGRETVCDMTVGLLQ